MLFDTSIYSSVLCVEFTLTEDTCLEIIIKRNCTAPGSPNLKTRGEFVSKLCIPNQFFIFFIMYFREAQIMVGRKYTTFYLPPLKLA